MSRDTSTVVQVADAIERVFARRGLAALFWSNINPCGTFCLEMDKWLERPAYGWSQPGSPQVLVSRVLTLHTALADAADRTNHQRRLKYPWAELHAFIGEEADGPVYQLLAES
jgi:hypothetical protein